MQLGCTLMVLLAGLLLEEARAVFHSIADFPLGQPFIVIFTANCQNVN